MAFTSSTSEVAAQFSVNRQTLARLRAADVLRPGVHFVCAGTGMKRPNLRWDAEKVSQALQRRSRQLAAPRA